MRKPDYIETRPWWRFWLTEEEKEQKEFNHGYSSGAGWLLSGHYNVQQIQTFTEESEHFGDSDEYDKGLLTAIADWNKAQLPYYQSVSYIQQMGRALRVPTETKYAVVKDIMDEEIQEIKVKDLESKKDCTTCKIIIPCNQGAEAFFGCAYWSRHVSGKNEIEGRQSLLNILENDIGFEDCPHWS